MQILKQSGRVLSTDADMTKQSHNDINLKKKEMSRMYKTKGVGHKLYSAVDTASCRRTDENSEAVCIQMVELKQLSK